MLAVVWWCWCGFGLQVEVSYKGYGRLEAWSACLLQVPLWACFDRFSGAVVSLPPTLRSPLPSFVFPLAMLTYLCVPDRPSSVMNQVEPRPTNRLRGGVRVMHLSTLFATKPTPTCPGHLNRVEFPACFSSTPIFLPRVSRLFLCGLA